jgi:PKD repeat protein
MNKLFTLIAFAISFPWISAQDVIINSKKIPVNQALFQKFRQVEEYEINVEDIRKKLENVTKIGVEIELNLDSRKVILQLFEYDMFKGNAVVKIQTANGIVTRKPSKELRTFRGISSSFSGGNAGMTVAKDFLAIIFNENGQTYYLEQKNRSLDPNLSNQFILYKTSDVLPVQGVLCGADLVNKSKEDHKKDFDEGEVDKRNKRCYEVDLALACDWSYASFYKSPPAAEAAMVNVANFMQLDWATPLWAEYIYGITDIWISPDSLLDPWRNSNDIFTHLDLFTTLQFSIFTNAHDVATLWTTKFTSGAVGVAWLSSVCSVAGVNVCSEFTQGIFLLKQLQSHEIGHNFSCTHDPLGPTIMSPVVNGSGTWSFQSLNQISDYTIRNGGCLADCSGGNIPVAEFDADPPYGCIPLTVQYNNLSVNGISYKWTFSGGNPATSTDANPVVTYNSIGKFDVTLEVMNPKCTVKVTKPLFIETNDLPTADFTGGNVDLVVLFVNRSQRGVEYFWNFGDGETSEEFMPEHEYAKDGLYKVCLTVTNDCGSKTICKNIGVYTYPIAEFTSDTTWGCAPKTIKFFDRSSSNVINWTWSFPGGTPSGSFQKDPVVKYTNPGVYKVKLSVNTPKFSTSITKEMYIRIDSIPDAKFSYQSNGPNVDFTNKSVYANTHFWDFGDGATSVEESPSYQYRDGRYEVKYTATNACGSTTVKDVVIIGTKPTAGFRTQSPVGCVPFTVQYENTSTSSATDFIWTFPGGNPSTSTDRNPIVTYNAKGKYDAKLVAKNFLESDSLTLTDFIEVKVAPTAEFQNSITGFVAYFTNLSTEATNYYWDFGDNKTSTEANPSHNYGVEGEFNVRLITENECGIDTFDKLIAVYLIPKVNFTADTIRGCAPLNVMFADQSSIDVLEWNWQFENGMPGVSNLKNPIVRFNMAGTYTVKLSVKNSNGTNSATKVKYIEVLSPVLCPKKPGKKGPKSLPNDEALVQVDMSQRAYGILETKIFPNPTNSSLHIQTKENTNYSLVNMTGQKIVSGKTNSITTTIDVSEVQPGTYFVRLENSQINSIHKVIISK